MIKRWYRWVLASEAGVIVVALGLAFARVYPHLASDFALDYGSSRMARLGVPMAQVYTIGPLQTWMGASPSCAVWPWHLALAYPPLFVLLFAPLTLPPCAVAAGMWAVLNGVLVVILLWLCGELVPMSERLFFGMTLLVALSFPLVSGVRYGQIHIVLAVLLAGGAWLLQRGYPAAAGLLLAVAAWIQIIPGLFLVFFVVTRQWRAALGMVAGGLMGLGVQIVVFGAAWIPAFVARLFSAPVDGAMPGRTSDGLISWLGRGGLVLSACVVLIYVGVLIIHRAGLQEGYWWTATSMIILSPVAWVIFLTWLVPLYTQWWTTRRRWLSVLALGVTTLMYVTNDVPLLFWLIVAPTWIVLAIALPSSFQAASSNSFA